jgi:A/G-specific adenine glycosylase
MYMSAPSNTSALSDSHFSERLLTWFEQHGRHDLPWQVTDDPYKVWVSEIMLQQTQVKTVLQYFDRFMQRFPSVQDLGNASWDEVVPFWAGLGYYARARNLHKAAGVVSGKGQFPQTLEQWIELSGVGPSTAGALMSLGLRQFGVIMDGNVKRVLSRYLALEGDSTSSAFIKNIWQIAKTLTPQTRAHDYNQAIMDLGATLCTPKKPLCLYCPMQSDCAAFQQNRVLELPQKTARKATPTRHASVLMIQHNQQRLWQQRPSKGLWGGLWSLPVLENSIENDIEQTVAHLNLINGIDGKKIRHTFTHFHWQLQAIHFDFAYGQKEQLEAHFTPCRWMSDVEAFAAGVPEAMRKLLAE